MDQIASTVKAKPYINVPLLLVQTQDRCSQPLVHCGDISVESSGVSAAVSARG